MNKQHPVDETLPPDAQCQRCGYPLKALTERRCPECGQSFDPATYTLFVPLWPWLLALQLCAWAAVAAKAMETDLVRGFFAESRDWLEIPLALVVNISLPLVASVGLFRRQEWGRKLTIVYLLIWLASPVIRNQQLGDIAWSWAVALPLVVFLATGLRSDSLSRWPSRSLPRISLQRWGARDDWGLLFVLLLLFTALPAAFAAHGYGMTFFALPRPHLGVEELLSVGGRLCILFLIGWPIFAAVRVWHNPQRARFTAALLMVVQFTWIALVLSWALVVESYPAYLLLRMLSGYLGYLLSGLVLVVFAHYILPKHGYPISSRRTDV